ncbi:MAG: DNA-protecting protein DprA [Phycisphaerales bacterium]|nr:DNA-protecting protein DprA [Phycisphaerales bacterium]
MSVISAAARTHLRWALIDGIGPLTFGRLLIQFGDAERAGAATASELQLVPGIGPGKAENILRARDNAVVEQELEAAEQHGVRIVCRADADYPPGLRQIPDAPIVLFVKGELRPTDAIAVAIVGSRRCTLYGSEQARRFGELLAGAGFTVVSGLARGIDAFAHHGAVDAGGRSVAVMGRGLDAIYPPENAALAAKLLDHGAWISELPIAASVRAENFPGRNRIIAGMTLGTIVIEAGHRSGALITARFASEYNREVFAVPGRVQDPMSMGTNALIRDSGAKLVTCLEDVLAELGDVGVHMRPVLDLPESTYSAARAARSGRSTDITPSRMDEKTTGTDAPAGAARKSPPGSGPSVPLSVAEQRVFDVLGFDPLLQDAVIRLAELPAGEVLAALTTLELKGRVKRLPGNVVVRHGVA